MLQLSCSLGFLFYAEAVDAGLRVGLSFYNAFAINKITSGGGILQCLKIVTSIPENASFSLTGGAAVGLYVVPANGKVPVCPLRPFFILFFREECAFPDCLSVSDGKINPFPVFKSAYGDFRCDRGRIFSAMLATAAEYGGERKRE